MRITLNFKIWRCLSENNLFIMKDNLIRKKSYSFAITIVRLYQQLTVQKREFILSKQCLRSGTAIGALVSESIHAQSKADFINKINIALKEANETLYWIDLMKDTDYISKEKHASLYGDGMEIVKILASIL